MKKKVILRCLIGAPIGLSISFMITLIISVIINKGEYYPVVPQLTALCGNELNAVIIQAVCSLIYGAAFGGASAIWEVESWSLLKQTVIHCLVISVSMLPCTGCRITFGVSRATSQFSSLFISSYGSASISL